MYICDSGRVTALGFNSSLLKKKREKNVLAGHWGAYCDPNTKSRENRVYRKAPFENKTRTIPPKNKQTNLKIYWLLNLPSQKNSTAKNVDEILRN